MFASTSNPQGDTISSTGILGGLDLELGRQHLFANGTAQTNRYRNFDQLNNVSYGFTGGLNWQTIERLSGNLRYEANQSLANYADVQFPTTIRDVQRTQAASAAVRYGITPRLGIEGSAAHRTVNFSAPEDTRGFRTNVASLGLRWGGTGLLTLGAGVRLTKNDFPSALIVAPVIPPPPVPPLPPAPILPGVYGPDKTDRRDIDFTGTWTPSGLSSVTGRISLTRETHTQPAIPKLSGVTGSLSWDYRPTGKIALNTMLTRDTGSETTFFTGQVGQFSPLRPDNDRVNTVLEVHAKYEATAKILVNGDVRHINGAIVNSLGGVGNISADSIALGANYAITRAIDFSCSLGYESRSHSYNATTVGCAGRITLR
ncbi:MAG TPA: hypothetical protein VKI18_02290 [Albitalea sp.]|nr:hypothetical protein [Albitalea sp.]